MAADYRHIGGHENRLGRHYSRFSAFWPAPALAGQSLALRKLCDGGSNRRSRVLEVFRLEDVLAGVREAIARGVIGFDAVKHLVLCRIERRPPRLDLTVYPYLPRATVAITSAKAYLDLLTGASS